MIAKPVCGSKSGSRFHNRMKVSLHVDICSLKHTNSCGHHKQVLRTHSLAVSCGRGLLAVFTALRQEKPMQVVFIVFVEHFGFAFDELCYINKIAIT